MGKHKLKGPCIIEQAVRNKCHGSVKDIAAKLLPPTLPDFIFDTRIQIRVETSTQKAKIIAAERIGMGGHLAAGVFHSASQRRPLHLGRGAPLLEAPPGLLGSGER